MAKETKFINPYNFIPQFKGVVRKQNNLNEGTLTGYIECELTTKTPMIIVDPESMDPLENGDNSYSDTFRLGDGEKTPAIPASALRGMIRSKYETLTNSCMSNYEELKFDGKKGKIKSKILEKYKPCEEELCCACSLFGLVNGGKNQSGRVRVSDALCKENADKIFEKDKLTLAPLNSPSYDKDKLYFIKNNGKIKDIRGRKEYWHHSPNLKSKKPTKMNSTVPVLKEGLKYNFFVYFENITEEELKQLRFSISLGNATKYHHKLGMGKPLGFGSVKVTITDTIIRTISKDENKIGYQLEYFKSEWDDEKNGEKIVRDIFDLEETQVLAIDHMYRFDFIKDKGKVHYPQKMENPLPFANKEYDDLIQHGHDKPYRKFNNRRKNHASKNHNKYK